MTYGVRQHIHQQNNLLHRTDGNKTGVPNEVLPFFKFLENNTRAY